MNLEERAQRIIDLSDELQLHETFWRAEICSTSLIIAEHSTIIALCEEILPDMPKRTEKLEVHIAELKRRRKKYIAHRVEEVTEVVRERLDEVGLDHIEITSVERIETENER